MTDPGPRTRELLRDSTEAPAMDRAAVWTGVRARHEMLARRRNVIRWSLIVLAGSMSVVAAWFGARMSLAFRARVSPVPIAADSIEQTPSGAEPMVTQQQETPVGNALMPLLGHRTQLRMDIDHLTTQRRELTIELTRDMPAANRQIILRELADTEQQLASSKRALELIDAQLARGQPAAAAAAPNENAPVAQTYVEVPQIVTVGPPLISWIAGTGAIIVLAMMAMLMWVRRTTRATLRELAALRTQSGTQLSTLAEGVEAIALEVERIGEGQRYLSKMVRAPQDNVNAEQRAP